MTDGTECTCDLVETSTYAKVSYMRGLSRGCPVHPPTQHELDMMAREAERERIHAEARRRAREAP